MFATLTRPRSSRGRPPAPPRLSVFRLESRDGPASLAAGVAPVWDAPAFVPASSAPAFVPAATATDTESHGRQLLVATDDAPAPLPVPVPVNKPPQIVNFKAVCHAGGVVVFTGKVIDEAPSGLTVTFGGAPRTTDGLTTVTKADGTFELTVRMKTDGTDAGTVEATTVDNMCQKSNTAEVDVSPRP